jgi:DNA-binding transcriptional regulator YhcF (GntR family)
MSWAVRQKVGNATGKAVLLMLANYADEAGECFPSQERLATECECSVATVQRWLRAFEECGAVEKTKQYGEGGYRRADRIRLRTDLHITKLPSTELPNSVSELTPHKARAEPIKEPTSLRSVSSSARDVVDFRQALGDLLESDLVETLVQSRRKKRAAINANAGRLLNRALRRCPDPRLAAEEMALRGWTSVKPEWLESRQSRAGPREPRPDHFKNYASELNGQDRDDRGDSGHRDDAQGFPLRTIEHH